VDENRFKLRTPERNYTFKADTADGRDEWVKSIQKVMFKTQHEGESVKLIIPLEAVLDVEKTPTLEFAETIEVRCVDSEDQMSVDSYFFASFQNGEKALKSIKERLDARPSSDLPANDSAITLPTDESAPQKQRTTQEGASHAATSGLKKLGSLLKPIIHGSSSKHDNSHKDEPVFERDEPDNDSLETLTPTVNDGYPPRQSGAAPAGMGEEKGWGGKLFKPVSKILGTSPTSTTQTRNQSGHSSEHRRASDHLADQLHIRQHLSRTSGRKGTRESVTEVVEPTVNDGTATDSEDDDATRKSARAARMSFTSSGEQGYSMMEQTEEDDEEYAKTAKKFRSVFSLSEKEELIDRTSLPVTLVEAQAHNRLPGILVSSLACFWSILRFPKLLLFPIFPTTLQDQGKISTHQ
jgi:sterol 3beta-glucosyltransferase